MTERPRIPHLPVEEWTDEARAVFAYWEGEEARQNGSRLNTMLTMAQHPPLALAVLDMGKYFMLGSMLTARQIKLIVLRAAHRRGSNYQWQHNAIGARQLGISADEVEAVKTGSPDPTWSAEDRLLLEAVDVAMDGGNFDDALWERLAATFDKRLIMDLIHAAGYFAMVAAGLVAMGVEVEANLTEVSRNRAKRG